MPFKDPVDRKKYYDNKYTKAKENAVMCETCNKSYNMFTQNNHMKSKHHLHMQEITHLKIQVEVMKNLFNVNEINITV
jgi:hypothetical protein